MPLNIEVAPENNDIEELNKKVETSIIPDGDFFKNTTPDQVFTGVCYAVSWVLPENNSEEVSFNNSHTHITNKNEFLKKICFKRLKYV